MVADIQQLAAAADTTGVLAALSVPRLLAEDCLGLDVVDHYSTGSQLSRHSSSVLDVAGGDVRVQAVHGDVAIAMASASSR